jgi:hypothetical protein
MRKSRFERNKKIIVYLKKLMNDGLVRNSRDISYLIIKQFKNIPYISPRQVGNLLRSSGCEIKSQFYGTWFLPKEKIV